MPPLNPFKPGTGATPPVLVGRQPLLDNLADGLEEGPGAPARVTLFTGARGVGKTVMLSEASDLALRSGWLHIDETASTGMMGRLDEHVSHALEDRQPRPRGRVTGGGVTGLGSINVALTPELTVGFRRKVGQLLDALAERDPSTGLLITVDEVQSGVDDLRELAITIQHLIREERQIAIVMAGLPSAVSDVLRAHGDTAVLTFLRRADKHVIGDVSIDEVRDAFEETFDAHGRSTEAGVLDLAAEATYGYPFLIQLVGYHVWRQVRGAGPITLEAARAGIDVARRRLGSLVHETALADLSDTDKTFLAAMSPDEGPSRMQDIRARMGGISSQHANRYRERLLAAQMIRQAGRGYVDFALPYLRGYLRDHAGSYGLVPDSED